MVEVEVAGVKVDLRSNSPVLLLQELSTPYRVVPIFIGVPEANAIDLAIANVDPPRPLTHDLACTFLEVLDAQISQVVVTEVRNGTYYAEVTLVANGIEHRISARPSDSVALAIRSGASIFIDEAIMNAEGTVSMRLRPIQVRKFSRRRSSASFATFSSQYDQRTSPTSCTARPVVAEFDAKTTSALAQKA